MTPSPAPRDVLSALRRLPTDSVSTPYEQNEHVDTIGIGTKELNQTINNPFNKLIHLVNNNFPKNNSLPEPQFFGDPRSLSAVNSFRDYLMSLLRVGAGSTEPGDILSIPQLGSVRIPPKNILTERLRKTEDYNKSILEFIKDNPNVEINQRTASTGTGYTTIRDKVNKDIEPYAVRISDHPPFGQSNATFMTNSNKPMIDTFSYNLTPEGLTKELQIRHKKSLFGSDIPPMTPPKITTKISSDQPKYYNAVKLALTENPEIANILKNPTNQRAYMNATDTIKNKIKELNLDQPKKGKLGPSIKAALDDFKTYKNKSSSQREIQQVLPFEGLDQLIDAILK